MYKYVNPKEKGYILTNLSKSDLQKVFTKRNFKWYTKVDVWHKEKNNTFLIEETKNIYFIFVATIAYPFACICSLREAIETTREYFSLFNQKKKGKHRSDTTHKKSEINEKLHKLEIKKHNKRKIF